MALVVLFLRRPDALLDAKFWAEDGKYWYAQAHNDGVWASLFRPHTGYLQTFSRVTFSIAQIVPLEYAPMLANALGLIVRALPALLLASRRFDWADWRARLLIATFYLLMPGIDEVHPNITNAHWYIGLYMLMVVVSVPPRSRWGQVHDYGALLIGGLSGPFIAFLIPSAAIRVALEWKGAHRRWSLALLSIAAALSALQISLILLTGASRNAAELGATLTGFAKIVASRVLSLDITEVRAIFAESNALSLAALALAVFVLAVAIRNAGWRVAALASYAGLLLGAALASPVMADVGPIWPLFLIGGDRYFVVPI
ncbi:MAG TPA: hypothetical protein VFE52_00690, partial [Devosia sp.]|nr:hypothetical protein [Devosia sp.]